MPTIDVHTHFLPEPYVQALIRHGVNWTGGVDMAAWTPEDHLRFMDDWGIDAGVLSCLAEGGVYFGDQREASELARNVNDIGADVVRRHPQRFGVFGALPLPGVEAALAEIDHVYDDLGLDGVYLVSQVDGTYVGDPAWEPVYHWIGEYVFDTTRVFMTLVFNGVLDRYPNINWILSHGGGAVPYLGHRIAAAPRVVAAYRELVRRPISEYLRSVYYDVAVADSSVQVNTMVDAIGTDRILFGTDWPYADGLFDPKSTGEHDLTRLLGPDHSSQVAGTNALRILPRLAERWDDGKH